MCRAIACMVRHKKVTGRAKNSGRRGATGAQGGKVLATAKRFFEWCIDEDYIQAKASLPGRA
jgi:hypothetical protein